MASGNLELGPGLTSVATTPPVSKMLRPLELFDLSQIYVDHAILIDLVLYLMLFNGIAQATLSNRLEGKGGRLVAAAIGSSLALALSGLGWATGFSVLALGPVAAIILLGIVGTMIFRTLRAIQVSRATAGSLAFIVVALSLRAAAPEFAQSIERVFPVLGLGVVAGFIILIWKGLSHLLPRGSEGQLREQAAKIEGAAAKRSPTRSNKSDPIEARFEKKLKKERPFVTDGLKQIVRRESKESRAIIKELEVVRNLLRKGKHEAKSRSEIAEALRRIPPKRHRLHTLIAEVKELDQRLERFDLRTLNELRIAYQKVPEGQRALIKKLALEERKKVKSEERIQVIEQFIAVYDTNSAKSVQMGAESILKNNMARALKWVEAAIKYEKEARRGIKRAHALGQMLKRIIRLELRQIRQAA